MPTDLQLVPDSLVTKNSTNMKINIRNVFWRILVTIAVFWINVFFV